MGWGGLPLACWPVTLGLWASPGHAPGCWKAVGFPERLDRWIYFLHLPVQAARSLGTLQPFLQSGSYTRPSSPRRVPAWCLPGVSLSAMAPADTWVPAGLEPSSCVWAVRWVPARCRTSATACGSSSGRPAPGTQPPWTPAAPTATAELGGRPVPARMLHPSPRAAAEPPAQSACGEKPLEGQCRHQPTLLPHSSPPRSAATSLQLLWT